MSHTTDTIVQDLHAEFESMLNFVKDSRAATADQMERGLFKRLLHLGMRLMLLFFALRTAAAARDEHQLGNGETLPYRAEHRRQYFSVFGKLAFWRPYFYRADSGGASPLDQELALGSDCYSDLVRELVEYLGVDSTYAKVANCFAQLLGLQGVRSGSPGASCEVAGVSHTGPIPPPRPSPYPCGRGVAG